MIQFLLIQKNSALKDYIEIFLSSYGSVCVVTNQTVNEAIKELDNKMPYDCVFVGSSLIVDGDVKVLTDKFKTYLQQNPNCKIIGTNRGFSTQEGMIYVPSMVSPAKLVDVIRATIGLENKLTDKKLMAIPITGLSYFPTCPCDVFFKIGNGTDESAFVKRFNSGDQIDPEDLQKYIKKGVKQVHVAPEYIEKISETITGQIQNKVAKSANATNQLEIATEGLEYASYVLKSIGITPQSQQVAQGIITSIITAISSLDKNRFKSFSDILNAKEDFYHKHLSLTAMLSLALLDELQWDVNKTAHSTVTYAAFFHNFFIHDEEDITCIDELTFINIPSQERRDTIYQHAKLAAEFIQGVPGVPYEARKLIMEQHGSLTGIGFPIKKSSSTPLSALFMIANEFALKFLVSFEGNSEANVQELLKEALEVYGKGNIKILEALQNCMAAHIVKT